MWRLSFILSMALVGLTACDSPTDLPDLVPNEEHYGPCTDTYGRGLCLPDEEGGCLSFPFEASSHYACSAPCEVDADCPDRPADSGPVVRCIENTCQLRCVGGGVCPLGMDCPDDITCLWPI